MSDLMVRGPQYGGTGSASPFTADLTGAQRSVNAHANYSEAVRAGSVYTLQTKSATVTAVTDISPLPATTGRGLIGIINPIQSGFYASIIKVGISTISGTPGGPFYFDVIPNAITTLASPGVAPTNNRSLVNAGSQMIGVVAAVPGNSVIARMLRPIGGPAAVATGAGLYSVDEDVAGAISIPPGGLLVVTAHAVGTTHVVSLYLTWEEIPVLP